MKLTKRKDGRYCKKITIDGKQVAFYGKTEKEILNKIRTYREKQDNGKTFAEVADEWDTEHREYASAATIKRYAACLERATEYFGSKYIKEITVSQVDNYIKLFAKTGMALKTVKMQRSVINMIFKYAVLKEYITTNPCQYVPVPKNLKQTCRELPEDSDIEIVKNGVNCTFGLFAYLILYTGLRRGEALALQYKDFDFGRKIIHVTKSVSHAHNVPEVKEPKTAAGTRDVILLDCLADKIPKLKQNDYLFSNSKGELLHGSNFNRLWDKYVEETGVKLTPHQLRHAYATILFEAGINDKDAQTLMGHSSINLTRDIYTHIREKRMSETAGKLNQYVSKVR